MSKWRKISIENFSELSGIFLSKRLQKNSFLNKEWASFGEREAQRIKMKYISKNCSSPSWLFFLSDIRSTNGIVFFNKQSTFFLVFGQLRMSTLTITTDNLQHQLLKIHKMFTINTIRFKSRSLVYFCQITSDHQLQPDLFSCFCLVESFQRSQKTIIIRFKV